MSFTEPLWSNEAIFSTQIKEITTQYRPDIKLGSNIYINRIDAEEGGTLGYDTEGVSGKTPEKVSFKIAALNLNAVRIFLVEAEIK